jgi:hypothetical protein
MGALVLGAAALLVAIQGMRFERRVAAEARGLWTAPGAEARERISLDGLPAPVRRYLELSGAAQRDPVRAVRLSHGGTFRPALEKGWLPIRGVQYFGTDPPGFVWWGRIRVAPGLFVEALDRSLAGEGNMQVRVASTWTLADARGPELDQGALLRLLAEMVWFPTALLDQRYVEWAPVDGTSARATLRVGGRAVSATFHFGPEGLPSRLSAERYREVGGKGVLTPWSGEYRDYWEVGGLLIPFRTEVSWRVDGRELPYARWTFEEVELDRAEPY